MKKLVSIIATSLLTALPASADYLLTIQHTDGTQTQQCVSSYSFTKVIEEAATQDNVLYDVYSEEETLTNKIFMGKPVYRKVIKFPRSYSDTTINHNITGYEDIWIDHFSSVHDDGTVEGTSYYASNSRDNFIRLRPGTITFYGRTDVWVNVTAVVEYTKVDDQPVVMEDPTKTYLNYVPSATGTPVILDINGVGITFSKNYAYDATANTCIAK